MSFIQHLQYGFGGTVQAILDDRPSVATCRIVAGNGTEILAPTTATISSINTTLLAAATKGDLQINVASNAGIVNGMTFFIQDDPEEVLIKRVSGNTVYLRRPLMYDHVNAATCEGTRISLDVNSATASTLFWDGRCEWNIGTKQIYTSVECTKYSLDQLCQMQDIYDIEPKLYYLMDDEDDIVRLKTAATQHVLTKLTAVDRDARARIYPGSSEFVQAVAFAFMMLFYMRQRGDDSAQLVERYKASLENEINMIATMMATDRDQDGVVEAEDKLSVYSIALRRG